MSEAANGWSDFFVAEVGAAATLSGLVIVAISINLSRILSFPHLPGRAAEILMMLVGALLACSVALVPDQSTKVFGAEIIGIGLFMTAVPIFIQMRALMIVKNQPVSWWLWRLLMSEVQQLTLLAVEFDVQAIALDLHAAALNEAQATDGESLDAVARTPYSELQPHLPRCNFLFGRDHSDIEQSFHARLSRRSMARKRQTPYGIWERSSRQRIGSGDNDGALKRK